MEGTDSGLLNTNKTHSDGFEGGVETGVFSRIFRFFCLFLIFWGDEREEELRGGEENINVINSKHVDFYKAPPSKREVRSDWPGYLQRIHSY